jgi:hypothetical protein
MINLVPLLIALAAGTFILKKIRCTSMPNLHLLPQGS